MQEITNYKDTSEQTPIEIALQVDENGSVSTRKLYTFLELEPDNFTRWCKRKIIKNELAIENEDYQETFTEEDVVMPQGRGTKIVSKVDYKLSVPFAKKLCMLQQNERGEQARDYFLKVEETLKSVVSNLPEMTQNEKFLQLAQNAVELERQVKKQDEKIIAIDKDLNDFKQDMRDFKQELPLLGVDMDKITRAVQKKGVHCLGGKESNAYKDRCIRQKLYSDIHCEIRRQFGVSTYKAIKRNQCEAAIAIVDAYVPPLILENQIANSNMQIRMDMGD